VGWQPGQPTSLCFSPTHLDSSMSQQLLWRSWVDSCCTILASSEQSATVVVRTAGLGTTCPQSVET
jgi:hypothetical protein